SDFSNNTEIQFDYFNPVMNMEHVISFFPAIHQYQHQMSTGIQIRSKYVIRFALTNNLTVDWQFDDRKRMEDEIKKLSKHCSATYNL
ncbi:hypothetical protein ACKI1Q_43940, partial [Streptomyces galilaeus]|uniref:hypothetical protein n=1 Tax=Streptomyces galilaeus TaxID=33899 RepID=UPI0038F67C00